MKFEITQPPYTDDLEFLTQKINEEAEEVGKAYPFAIFVRDEDGKVIAGCSGSIIFGSIYTDQLWVAPDFRKKGIGKQLMEKAHEYGSQNSCLVATVTTMDFQAPDFYKKLGYKVDFSRKGHNKNSSAIFMSKKL